MPKGRIKDTYKHSEETKRKIGLACKGHRVSEKTKQRIGNLQVGRFGKNHPCYKENKKHCFYKLIRETFKYRQWRSDIFTRDNFICVLCGEKGGYLVADHYPKRFIDILNEYKINTLEKALVCEELWNINNGRTLHNKCHFESHLKTKTWGRRKEDAIVCSA